MADRLPCVSRKIGAARKDEHNAIRRYATVDFAPIEPTRDPAENGSIALAIYEGRTTQCPTFEQVVQQTRLAQADAVRDIEFGAGTRAMDITALAHVLDLRLELVTQVPHPRKSEWMYS